MLLLHTRVWDMIPIPALLSLEEFTVILEILVCSMLLKFWCAYESLVKIKIAGPFLRISHTVGLGLDQELHFNKFPRAKPVLD